MSKKKNYIVYLFLLLIPIISSCISHKEYVENLAKDTVHNWLEWKYSPIGDITYNIEEVYATEEENGNCRISYSAYIQCTAQPYATKTEAINGSVNLLLDYINDEDRCDITNIILLP